MILNFFYAEMLRNITGVRDKFKNDKSKVVKNE